MEEMIYEHVVQYYETDAMGIVHHSNYIRWFEEARTWMLEKVGFGYAKMEETGVVSPVTGVSAEYKRSVKYGQTVSIKLRVTGYTGTRIFIGYEVFADGELKCVGESKHCFLTKEGRPVSLKRDRHDIDQIIQALYDSSISENQSKQEG